MALPLGHKSRPSISSFDNHQEASCSSSSPSSSSLTTTAATAEASAASASMASSFASPPLSSTAPPPPTHTTSSTTSPTSPPIVNHANRAVGSPSIRQSWLSPVNRAAVSTSLPDSTVVVTLNQRPTHQSQAQYQQQQQQQQQYQHQHQHHESASTGSSSSLSNTNTSTSHSSSSSSTSGGSAPGISAGHPPSTSMNQQRRNFSGSARSRLNMMMIHHNGSAPSLSADPSHQFPHPASPRSRARLSLQNTPAGGGSGSFGSIGGGDQSLADDNYLANNDGGGTINSMYSGYSTSTVNSIASVNSTASYPRHILMNFNNSSALILEDEDEASFPQGLSATPAGSSLPLANGFSAGMEDASTATSGSGHPTEKSNRHASMPLPRPGWILYDLPDLAEDGDDDDDLQPPNARFMNHDSPNTSGSGFHYSASNSSSYTNLGQTINHSSSNNNNDSNNTHTRQSSNGTSIFTMTPSNQSTQDLTLGTATSTSAGAVSGASVAESLLALSLQQQHITSINGPAVSSSPPVSNSHFYNAQHQQQQPSHSKPTHKAHKNIKSPLALKRSSTTSIASSSSPSNTFPGSSAAKVAMAAAAAASGNVMRLSMTGTLTQKRQKIVLEMLTTERTYVDGLILLQNLFFDPLNAPYVQSNSNTNNTLGANHQGNHPYQSNTFHSSTNHPHHQFPLHNNLQHHHTLPSSPTSPTFGYPSTFSTFASASSPTSTFQPQQQASNLSTATISNAPPLLSKKSISEIFSNFSEILQINTLLLTQLETRICGATLSTGWSDEEGEDSDASTGHQENENGEDRHPAVHVDDDEDDDDDDEELSPEAKIAARALAVQQLEGRGGPSPTKHTTTTTAAMAIHNAALPHANHKKSKKNLQQVLVNVKNQNGDDEALLVLDEDWCVGDIFIEIAPFLKMYSSYVKSFNSALAHINDCMNKNDRFTEFLKQTAKRPECRNLDFQAYLMMPVQRIPRYRMLLEQLLRHTPEHHPDHRKLVSAFQAMEQTATFVNETIRQHEMFGEMLDIQSKLSGLNEPLIIPGRVLIKRGKVWKICRRNVQLRVIMLFSDCLIWASPSSTNLLEDGMLSFHRKMVLDNCTVVGADDSESTKNRFQIMSSEKSSEVYVDSPREKENWMVAIRKATQEYLSAKRTLKISITPKHTVRGNGLGDLATGGGTGFGGGPISSHGGLGLGGRGGGRKESGIWSVQTYAKGISRSFYGGGGGTGNLSTMDAHQIQHHHQIMTAQGSNHLNNAQPFEGMHRSNTIETSNPSNTNHRSTGYHQQYQQPIRIVENYNAPVWVPDQSATHCMICTEEFGTIFRRKHHCRACGMVVCHSCSTRTIIIKSADSEKEGRACDNCITNMFPEEASAPAPFNFTESTTTLDPTGTSTPGTTIISPAMTKAEHRRFSSQSMDTYLTRSEEYYQQQQEEDGAPGNSSGGVAGSATAIVRGIVEAGLSRMKSRGGYNGSNNLNADFQRQQQQQTMSDASSTTIDASSDGTNTPAAMSSPPSAAAPVSTRGRNRRPSLVKNSTGSNSSQEQVKKCGLCMTEFGMFKWRNVCQQCRRVVCSDCLTKKQIHQLLWMRLELEREATAAMAAAGNSNNSGTSPVLPPSLNAEELGSQQWLDNSLATSSGSGIGGGNNTDSGLGTMEKLCDPCYLGLAADQVRVLESGGGWQYFQATMGKHQSQDIVAALALSAAAAQASEDL